MKKLFLLLFVVALAYVGYRMVSQPKPEVESATAAPTENPTTTIGPTRHVISSRSVFIPYWGLQNATGLEEYDKLIYFGISANRLGVDVSEPGYKNLPGFQKFSSSHSNTLLTLRLLNSDDNQVILTDNKLQDQILTETVQAAKEYDFKGVVLDLELSALPFTGVSEDINSFVERFEKKMKQNGLRTGVAIYGDVFYRMRPFDVKVIGEHTDEVFIMAYDFHKSYGEPGPNFPLGGKEEYGYDFQKMIGDYIQVVPTEKLTVIFGLYGYDWTLGDQGKPLKQAQAITWNQIDAKFIQTCSKKNCKQKRDTLSAESMITYVDEEGKNHVIWYEDSTSVEKKKEFLKKQGIGATSAWAWGYY